MNNPIGGDDYTPGIYNVMIPAGQNMVPFNIGIVDDSILEGNEEFDIVIIGATLPDGVRRGSPPRATVTIVDDDRKLLLSLQSSGRRTVISKIKYSVALNHDH